MCRHGYDSFRSSGHGSRSAAVRGRVHIETRHRQEAGHPQRSKKQRRTDEVLELAANRASVRRSGRRASIQGERSGAGIAGGPAGRTFPERHEI